ncbi:MAG: hypothetical protein P8P74_15830 [Crocinitomicaceae bacterium]|nr:hypothetical protein [Crocinitomicaceae bacterium]
MKPVFGLLLLLMLFSCNGGQNQQETWFDTDEDPKIEEPCKVELFSEQFEWTIRYSGADNILGKFDYKLTNDENPLALMTTKTIKIRIEEVEKKLTEMEEMSLHMEVTEEFISEQQHLDKIRRLLKQMYSKHDSRVDASAQDDVIITDTLILCVDKEYEFHFRSKDVIHSAYFPHFRFQTNTVPGMTTRFKFAPKETTKERRAKLKDDSFEFMLMCNKICGSGHYSMKKVIRVVDKDQYCKWLKSQDKNQFKNRTRT